MGQYTLVTPSVQSDRSNAASNYQYNSGNLVTINDRTILPTSHSRDCCQTHCSAPHRRGGTARRDGTPPVNNPGADDGGSASAAHTDAGIPARTQRAGTPLNKDARCQYHVQPPAGGGAPLAARRRAIARHAPREVWIAARALWRRCGQPPSKTESACWRQHRQAVRPTARRVR